MPGPVVVARVEPRAGVLARAGLHRDVQVGVIIVAEEGLEEYLLRDDERPLRDPFAEEDEDVDLFFLDEFPRHLEDAVTDRAAALGPRTGRDRMDLAPDAADPQLRHRNAGEFAIRPVIDVRADLEQLLECDFLDLLERRTIRDLEPFELLRELALANSVEPFSAGFVADDAEEVGVVQAMDRLVRQLRLPSDVGERQVLIAEEVEEELVGDLPSTRTARPASTIELRCCLSGPLVIKRIDGTVSSQFSLPGKVVEELVPDRYTPIYMIRKGFEIHIHSYVWKRLNSDLLR